MARAMFVTGFNRSGTTLVATAAAEAAGAVPLTAGHLARHMPSIRKFLASTRDLPTAPDRGVDRLPVTESTPEEYGWLLRAKTGDFAFGQRAAESGILQKLIDEVAQETGATAVVLKNPWDTGHEQLLLDSFPDSTVLIVRRQLAAIEDSLGRAWTRMAGSNDYVRSLIGNRMVADHLVGVMVDPKARADMVQDTTHRTRGDALQLARGAALLPLERVAFLSYDELRDDPQTGAAWAAHLVDPQLFSSAVARLSFPEYNQVHSDSDEVQAIDSYWASAWQRARAKQVDAGILAPAGSALISGGR